MAQNPSLLKNRWLILIVVLFANLPLIINMTLLHVAVPTLTTSLKATGTEVLWIIDIYALMMAGLLVPMGTLTDRIGARKVFFSGLFIFLLTSVLASFANTPLMLILARAAMAIGGAMLLPSELSVIRNTFTDDKERGLAIGSFGAALAAGGAIGPLVGGFVLEHFHWSAVFLINAPILVIALPLVYFICPNTPINKAGKWTLGQAALLVTGLLLTIYSLKSFFKTSVNYALLSGYLIAGLGLLFVFARKQLNSTAPMLDLGLLKKPAITIGFLIALVVSGAIAGSEFTIAQELQFAIGRSALEAGVTMMPMMLATAFGGPIAGVLINYFGVRWVSGLSLLVASGSFISLGLSDFSNIGLGITSTLVMLGLSLSIGLTASSIAIMGAAPPEKAGAAGSIEGVGYELGMGLGTTAFGLLLSVTYRNSIEIPDIYKEQISPQAIQSISDTMIAAKELSGNAGEALALAGRQAFVAAHGSVLFTAAFLVAATAVLVFLFLKNVSISTNHH